MNDTGIVAEVPADDPSLSLRAFRAIRDGARRLTKDRVILILPVLVAIAYGLLYVAYTQFYIPLGLHPSDVGLSRTRMLQESIIGPFVVATRRILNHRWWYGLSVVGLITVRALVHRKRKLRWRDWMSFALLLGASVFTVAFGLGYRQIFLEARSLGRAVRAEGHVVIGHVDRIWTLPVLDVKAIPVAPESEGLPDSATSGCLLYLGSSDGRMLFLDVRRDAILDLPADGIELILEVDWHEFEGTRLPEPCRVDTGNDEHPVEIVE